MCAILYSYHEKGNTYIPKGTNQKLKLYRLAQIMCEKTDETHYLTMPEIQKELEKYDIIAERRSLYESLKDLEEFGIEVEGERSGRGYRYHVIGKIYYREDDEPVDRKTGNSCQSA